MNKYDKYGSSIFFEGKIQNGTKLQKVRNQTAFTLVELIVVITIVGILSTIGFVAYSGYLGGARDGNRIASLTKLSDSLQTYSASKSLPLPDDAINITASGSSDIIGYQGYVGENILESINYTNGGKDPKDNTYFTYFLGYDRKKIQLLTFLEEQASFQTPHFFTENSIQTYASNYSNRFPKAYGQELGVLISSESGTINIPAQEISQNKAQGYLDVFHTNQNYKANFGKYGEKTATGKTLGMYILGGGTMLGYWGFNEGSGNIAYDSSGKSNNGVFSGTINPSYISGVKGTALQFYGNTTDSTIGSLVEINNGPSKGFDTPFFTVSAWIKPNYNASDYDRHGTVLKNYASSEGLNDLIFEIMWDKASTNVDKICQVRSIYGNFFIAKIKSNVNISQWNNIICKYEDEVLSIYLNGKLEDSVKVTEPLYRGNSLFHIGAGGWVTGGVSLIGKRGFFIGGIDEVSLFKKGLSEREIEFLYKYSQL